MSYKKSEPTTGRIDGIEPDLARFHQVVKYVDLNCDKLENNGKKSLSLLSFANDEGVRRNQGRLGAALGNKAIRQALASLPIHSDKIFFDAGIIEQDDNNLERH